MAETALAPTVAKAALLKIRALQARIAALEAAAREPIAIVGLDCRVPCAADPEAFWRLLEAGEEAIGELPPGRWDVAAWYDPDPEVPGRMYSTRGGYLDDAEGFDAGFFNISPREAASLDPQQRLILELGCGALEDAGIPLDRLAGTATGVFVGAMNFDYHHMQLRAAPEQLDAYIGTGNGASFLAGRLAYVLGLRGPCAVVDTACSSAAVAIHQAVQSLRRAECSLALVGGVNLILSPETGVTLSRLRALSASGRCRAFDAGADGYVRGEGAGMLVLERASDARRHGRRIRALILGTATNHSGASAGLTVPSGPAQTAVIQAALRDAGVAGVDLDYVEAHGTGTALGDPIESHALAAALERRGKPLLLGSVKTNIGHLEAASGVAGVIKVALMIERGTIPASLHFERENPDARLAAIPAEVPRAARSWPATERRLAGVSAFGMSGVNVHLVLAEPEPAPERAETPVQARGLHVLALSAKSATALDQLARRHEQALRRGSVEFADHCFSANVGRAHYRQRLALTAASSQDAADLLAQREPSHRLLRAEARRPPRVALMFTGQGALTPGACRELFESDLGFRHTLERCEASLADALELPLTALLYPAPGSAAEHAGRRLLARTDHAQPVLVAMQIALVELLRRVGIGAELLVGHSVGEIGAAHAAGVLDDVAALRWAVARGRAMEAMPAGAMVALDCSAADASFLDAASGLALAADHGPAGIVVAGPVGELEALVGRVDGAMRWRRLDTGHGFHSPAMRGAEPAIRAALATLTHGSPNATWISSVDARRIELEGQQSWTDYWVRQMLAPVRFAAALAALAGEGVDAFVEVGPRPVLAGLGPRCLPDHPGRWLALGDGHGTWSRLLETLATLYVDGAVIDWSALDAGQPRRRIAVPRYPFEHHRHWSSPGRWAPAHEPAQRPVSTALSVRWQPVELSSTRRRSGGVAIVGGGGSLGASLAAALRARDLPCVELAHAGDPLPFPISTIVELGAVAGECVQGELSGRTVLAREIACASGLLRLLADDARPALEGVGRMLLVSAGAQSASEASSGHGRARWGLGRTLANERPELGSVLVDLDPASTTAEQIAALLELVECDAGGGEEAELARRGSQWLAPRLSVRPPPSGAPAAIHPERRYLIAGGLGGLGQLLARALVARGARHIVVMSRSIDARVTSLSALDCELLSIEVDLADADALARALATLPQDRPLAGVYFCADASVDATLALLDRAALEQTLAPKVAGAWHLAHATRAADLDHFVLFGSAAALLGPAGQGAYAAANECLAALAERLVAAGRPAVLIDWGAWAEVGMSGRLAERARARWTRRGVRGLQHDEGFGWLWRLLGESRRDQPARAAVLAIDWPRFVSDDPRPRALLAELAGVDPTAPRAELPAQVASWWRSLPARSPHERTRTVERELRTLVARVIGAEPGALEPGASLLDLGVDSLMAVELRNALARATGLRLPASLVFDHPSVAGLSAALLQHCAPARELTHMTEVEAEAALSATLARLGLAGGPR